MTFRIDYIRRRHEDEWEFDIKGIEGRGVYGIVLTDGKGRGLYLKGPEPDFPPSFNRRELLPPEEFRVPPDATPEEATRLLAVALNRIGWGPEVDQRNRLREDDG